jgi:hypothetical protein
LTVVLCPPLPQLAGSEREVVSAEICCIRVRLVAMRAPEPVGACASRQHVAAEAAHECNRDRHDKPVVAYIRVSTAWSAVQVKQVVERA